MPSVISTPRQRMLTTLKGSAGALLLSGASLTAPLALATEVTIACGPGGDSDMCPELAQQWAEQSGNRVNVISTPNDTTEKLSLYQQLLSSGSSDIDVLIVDMAWPGLLDDHLVDLSRYLPDDATEGFFPALIDNGTVEGRLVAMPWYTDAGVLYYRKDLLEKYDQQVPETWQQLTETARTIQAAERDAGNADFWGYSFQGRAYEGLTCNALEWVASQGGGTLVDDAGEVTIDNSHAAQALDLAASWIGSIAPEGALNHTEEESRGLFQSGNALFLRNWPYVWKLSQAEGSPVAGKVGMAPLPHGSQGESRATLGGWNLAVSRYSEHPQAAAELVAYITAAPQQKAHAMKMGRNPTIEHLYQDDEVLASNPSMGELYEALRTGVARPASVTGDAYARVSNAFFNRTHQVLSGEETGAQAVKALERELTRIGRRGW